jgi:hypothetical protein
MVECVKCGDEIPEDASFCPGCGAPKTVGQPKPIEKPKPKPVTQPAPKSRSQTMFQPKPKKSNPFQWILDFLFSKTIMVLAFMLGLLFIWIGIIIAAFSSDNYSWAVLVSSLGFTGIAMFLLCGGIWNRTLDKYVRIIMIIIAGIILVTVLSWVLTISIQTSDLSSYFQSIFSSIPDYPY